MNNKIKTSLLLVSLSALLGGCAMTSAPSEPDAEGLYQDNLSRAKNIANFFGFRKIFDAKAPEGYKGDGSFLWNAAGWAGNLDAAANIGGALPGVSGWGSVGAGIGLGLLQAALAPDAQEETNHVFGYYPANKAKDASEARVKFIDQFAQAFIKTAKEQYPDSKITISERVEEPGGFMSLPLYRVVINFENDKEYCSKEYGWCKVALIGWKTTGPALMHEKFAVNKMAYKIMPGEGGNTVAPWLHFKEYYDFPKLMAGMAKYMPKDTFVYVATQKNNKGEKNPPFIVEKGRVDFFVSPQAKK